MNAVAALIDRLGGYTLVAAALNVAVGTVAAWRHRGSIPVRYWPALIAIEPQSGGTPVTYAELVAVHAGLAAEPTRARA